MKAAFIDVLDSITSLACIDVFGSYRVGLRELPRPAKGNLIPNLDKEADGNASLVASVVGFTGDDLRGALLLATTFEVIARARPSGLAQQSLSKDSYSDWVMVRDWASELGNQILGRIKNKLRPFNVVLEVSTPTAFSGRALAFAKPKSPLARPFLFDTRGDRVWLWLDASFDPRQVLVSGSEESAKEGDVILF
jgi:chemotaxis protein CheX